MNPITLSRRQIGDADRIGGIELMILWPASPVEDIDLGPEPDDVRLGVEREATSQERLVAQELVGAECHVHGLVPVHVRVTRLRRPGDLPAGGEARVHLAVSIIGRRWVHAKGARRGRVAFAK